MATVVLQDVSKQYDKSLILDKISLTIEKGEFLVVVGPSGCGKSTLLRLVAGLESISEGNILINDTCVNTIPPAKRDMAMVFQSYALYPHMTVFDNMAYALRIQKVDKVSIRQRVVQAAKLLQIESYLQRKPSELSGGQCQRVAMGRAIVRSPAVFLFDEPLSNLDAKLRGEMRYEIKKLHHQLSTTFMYVTHDQTEAMTMADRVLILNEGRVEQLATPAEVYKNPASLFVASFIGHYPMNVFTARIVDGGRKLRLGNEHVITHARALDTQRDRIQFAIRPEHISIADSMEHALMARVEFVEDMGADKLLRCHCETLGSKLMVRVSSDRVLQGEDIPLCLGSEYAHCFDIDSGKRIEDRL